MVLAECGDGEGPPLAAVDGWMADGSGVVPLSLEEVSACLFVVFLSAFTLPDSLSICLHAA